MLSQFSDKTICPAITEQENSVPSAINFCKCWPLSVLQMTAIAPHGTYTSPFLPLQIAPLYTPVLSFPVSMHIAYGHCSQYVIWLQALTQAFLQNLMAVLLQHGVWNVCITLRSAHQQLAKQNATFIHQAKFMPSSSTCQHSTFSETVLTNSWQANNYICRSVCVQMRTLSVSPYSNGTNPPFSFINWNSATINSFTVSVKIKDKHISQLTSK